MAYSLKNLAYTQTGVLVHKPEKCFAGYTLFCEPGNKDRELPPQSAYHIYLIDMEGNLVHRWNASIDTQLADLRPNGDLLFSPRDYIKPATSGIYRINPESVQLWWYHCCKDHDFHVIDNGNLMINCHLDKIVPRLGTGLRRNPYFIEIDGQDRLVWEWHGEDHLDELSAMFGLELPINWAERMRREFVEQKVISDVHRDKSPFEVSILINAFNSILKDKRLNELTPAEFDAFVKESIPPRAFDWAHNNTLEVLPDNQAGQKDRRFRAGNILFSYRQLDIIGVIDYPSGEIVWAWGPGELEGQHQPTMLPNGHILIFDNGWRRGWSRVVELDPLTRKIIWEYSSNPKSDFAGLFISGAQLLPNGNIFICEGVHQRFFEVTRSGEIVWDYVCPYNPFITHRIYRATRYTPDYIQPLMARKTK